METSYIKYSEFIKIAKEVELLKKDKLEKKISS